MGTATKDPLNSQSISGIKPSTSDKGYIHYRTENQSLTLTPEGKGADLLDVNNVDIFFTEVSFYTYSIHLQHNGATSAKVKFDDLDDRIIDLLRSY